VIATEMLSDVRFDDGEKFMEEKRDFYNPRPMGLDLRLGDRQTGSFEGVTA
jgi:hypothetical protein